jgi:hypothetical protein
VTLGDADRLGPGACSVQTFLHLVETGIGETRAQVQRRWQRINASLNAVRSVVRGTQAIHRACARMSIARSGS